MDSLAQTASLSRTDERTVIIAASLGTAFEWYDFYLYGVLTPILARLFFGAYPEWATLFALLAFAAGFIIRPFGALVFGRIGDLIGRKYTFLMTVALMGIGTFFVGMLPSAATWGIAAPILLVLLRLLQGAAMGGEYGGAATYVAEHAPPHRRGLRTAFIQLTATGGLILAIAVIVTCQVVLGQQAFDAWGWRIPFLLAAPLLVLTVRYRLRMSESPAYLRMVEAGTVSAAPIREAFGDRRNLGRMLAGLLGVAAGMTVIWYGSQFYSLVFMTSILKVDSLTANLLMGWALLLAAPFFLFFGWLSDVVPNWFGGFGGGRPALRAGLLCTVAGFCIIIAAVLALAVPGLRPAALSARLCLAALILLGAGLVLAPHYSGPGRLLAMGGRKTVLFGGCLLAAALYFPLFGMLAQTANPDLDLAQRRVPAAIEADPASCHFQFNPFGTRRFTSPCDQAAAALTRASVAYRIEPLPCAAADGQPCAVVVLGGQRLAVPSADFNQRLGPALIEAGYPPAINPGQVRMHHPFDFGSRQTVQALALLWLLVVLAAVSYGPVAASLTEMFPTRVRYTAMSFPYHVGAGWVGGMLPPVAYALSASSGNTLAGIWYPVIVTAAAAVIGCFFVPETAGCELQDDAAVAASGPETA